MIISCCHSCKAILNILYGDGSGLMGVEKCNCPAAVETFFIKGDVLMIWGEVVV